MALKDRDIVKVLLAVEEYGAEAKAALMGQGYSDDQIGRLAYQLGHLEKDVRGCECYYFGIQYRGGIVCQPWWIAP